MEFVALVRAAEPPSDQAFAVCVVYSKSFDWTVSASTDFAA